jgi:hypothetical protein
VLKSPPIANLQTVTGNFMTTKHTSILIFLLSILTLRVFAQTDSSNYYDQLENRIDSISKIIDSKNPKFSSLVTFPDSLAGEKVISVKKQYYKRISKYTIQTNRTGNRMDMKFATLYLYDDILILAAIFYNEDETSSWSKFYYSNNVYFREMLSSHGMRFSPEGNDKQFVEFANKILFTKLHK